MSYGIEVQGHTTLLGWDDSGEIEPWTELQAWATMIRLRCEFRKLGVMPLMRVVSLPEEDVRREAAGKAQHRRRAKHPPAEVFQRA